MKWQPGKWPSGPAYLRRLAAVPGAEKFSGRTLILGVVALAFALRLVYSAQVELLPEEAYYWNYARHLDIGYLDHPPLVAWLIRLGTALFGDTELGVRFAAPCCAATSAFFIFRLTRNLYGEDSALVAVLSMQLLPFFFLAGMLMTPDAPLTAAWAATLYFLERALVAQRANAWLWAGLCMGIGLLSKYTIALLGLSTFLFILGDPAARPWLRRWQPYAAALIALTVFAPVIVWNADHGWASFVFQTSRRLAENPRFSLHKLIGGALVLLTPTGFIAVAMALCARAPPRNAVQGSVDLARAWRLLRLSVLVPLTVFAAFSLRHEVKLDWTGAPLTAAIPLLASWMVGARQRSAGFGTWIAKSWPATLGGLLLIYGVGLHYLAVGLPGVGFTQHTELVPIGWRDLGRQVEGIAAEVRGREGEILVVGMDRYAIASELAFYSQNPSRSVARTSTAHLFGGMGLMYEQWFPVAPQAGRTLLLVAWQPADLATARLAPRVASLEPLQAGTVSRDGRTIRSFYYRVAHGYQPHE